MDGFDPFAADRPQPKPEPEGPVGSIHDQLQKLFRDDFERCLQDNPEWASQAGFNEYDGALQDMSPSSYDLRKEHNEEVLKALSKLDMQDSSVTDADRLQATLFKLALSDENAAYDLGCHLLCINSVGMGGCFESFIELIDWMQFENDDDAKKYLERLMCIPAQVNQWCDLLAYGAMRKITASKSMMRNVSSRFQELIDSDLAMLRKPTEKMTLHAEVKEQLEQAFENCFRGAVRRFKDFMEGFYADRVRAEPGVCALANGKEFYACCLRFHTTTNKSAAELHQLGLSEVARIQKRFQEDVLNASSFTGSVTDYADSLKKNPAYYYDSVADLLQGYRTITDEIEALLPKYFPVMPKAPLEIVDMSGSGPAAFYMAGTPDGKRPGRFFVNSSPLNERPKYEQMALALHEGIPGHHFQGSLALENDTLPDFLRYIEDRRYEMMPARRPMYTAYLEGWALYCERLGEEMGLYRTPQDLFGRLSFEALRASRLVVDTGIHDMGWSVEKAAKYMEENTGMHARECENECHRYAAWPGQACAYKVGQLAIEEMRTKAESALGKSFDLPSFHQVILGSGPVPLNLLGDQVDAWIKEKQGQSADAPGGYSA